MHYGIYGTHRSHDYNHDRRHCLEAPEQEVIKDTILKNTKDMQQALDDPSNRNRHNYGRKYDGRHDENINIDEVSVTYTECLEGS